MPTASEIFAFLESSPSFEVERYEISHPDFSTLRHNIRFIVVQLGDADSPDSVELSGALRAIVSEYLTVPAAFDGNLSLRLEALGSVAAIRTRWGADIGMAFERALMAARSLSGSANPLRSRLAGLIETAIAEGKKIRIFCNSRSRPQFESVLQQAPDETEIQTLFLHTTRDYRAAEPFDMLLKVGPLRSRGWGACPDAVITAPRFQKLLQVVWSGCSDEEGFGYDPVGAVRRHAVTGSTNEQVESQPWKRSTYRQETAGRPAQTETQSDLDDFEIFSSLYRHRDTRKAVLVQIDSEHGILYPVHAQVLSFNPETSDVEAISSRLAGEALAEGMFLIFPIISDVDLGELHAEDGHFSQIWKEKLNDELVRNGESFLGRLRQSGIELRVLRNAVNHWRRPSSTVIHAPQQKRHFEILVKVLGIEFETQAEMRRGPWWQHAWREIAHSRGEAIQEGMHGQEIIDNQLVAILGRMLPEIREAVATDSSFQINLPEGEALTGRVRFHRIAGLEDGFSAPDNALRSITLLDEFEPWRN